MPEIDLSVGMHCLMKVVI